MWFSKLPTSTETTEKFHYKKQGDTIVQKNTLKKPNSQYTLALSHRNKKNRSWLPLFSLFSLMRLLLTRLIRIISIFSLQHKPNIYIYILQVGYYQEIHSQLYSVILDRLTSNGLGLQWQFKPSTSTNLHLGLN